jgi:hypothetical protein
MTKDLYLSKLIGYVYDLIFSGSLDCDCTLENPITILLLIVWQM